MSDATTRQPLRIGLLGASAIAPWAIVEPARQRGDVQLQAVAARDLARAAAFAAEHGVAHVAADYTALLQRGDIDVVYIALPPSEHPRWSVAALHAGKAVLCENPLALSSTEVKTMFDAADAAQRPLWEAFHYQHHPAMQTFLATVRSGALGPLRQVQARFNGHMPHTPGNSAGKRPWAAAPPWTWAVMHCTRSGPCWATRCRWSRPRRRCRPGLTPRWWLSW